MHKANDDANQALTIPESCQDAGEEKPESVGADSGLTFADRVRLVASQQPFALARELDISNGTMTTWLSGAKPQRKSLRALEEKTDIPIGWWLRGEGEIPAAAVRRFGLSSGSAATAPQGADQPAAPARRRLPPVLDGSPEAPPPAEPAAGPHHRCEALFLLLMHLWISGRANWLPAVLPLAQVALLADRATARFTEFVGRQPTNNAPDGLELELSVNCLEWAWGAMARDGAIASPAINQHPPTDTAGSS